MKNGKQKQKEKDSDKNAKNESGTIQTSIKL